MHGPPRPVADAIVVAHVDPHLLADTQRGAIRGGKLPRGHHRGVRVRSRVPLGVVVAVERQRQEQRCRSGRGISPTSSWFPFRDDGTTLPTILFVCSEGEPLLSAAGGSGSGSRGRHGENGRCGRGERSGAPIRGLGGEIGGETVERRLENARVADTTFGGLVGDEVVVERRMGDEVVVEG